MKKYLILEPDEDVEKGEVFRYRVNPGQEDDMLCSEEEAEEKIAQLVSVGMEFIVYQAIRVGFTAKIKMQER